MFTNLSQLKDRVMPALQIKEEYFKKMGYNLSADDIWNLLKSVWKDSEGLSLNEMVNDILKLDINDINR